MTELNKSNIKKILSNWNIGKILNYRKATKGLVSNNWIIKTNKGKFILKNPEKDINLTFELNYLIKLKEGKFPYQIPNPILTKSNLKWIKINNKIFWLYQFIYGRQIQEDNNTKEEISEIAIMVSKYHNLLGKLKLSNKAKTNDLKLVLSKIKKHINQIQKPKDKKDKIFIEESNKIIPILNSINSKFYNTLKKYPIHADLNPENLIWKKDKLKGIIDFENVSKKVAPFLKDIAIILMYSCSLNQRLNVDKAITFLKKYQKYRLLSKQEIGTIPDTIITSYADFFAYSYWLLVNDPKRSNIKYLKENSSALLWYNKNKDKIRNKIKNEIFTC